jgi:hypothetical protein
MPESDKNKLPKMTENEARELEYLWKNYVLNSRKCHRRLAASHIVALILVLVALFVEDELAWHAVAVVVEVVNHTFDDVLDALGIQRY